MNEPRFISVDTSNLNDGDTLAYDAVSHSIIASRTEGTSGVRTHTQTGHGFTMEQARRALTVVDESVFAFAYQDEEASPYGDNEVVGSLVEVIDANTFRWQPAGPIVDMGYDGVAGPQYLLENGSMTNIKPTHEGDKYVVWAIAINEREAVLTGRDLETVAGGAAELTDLNRIVVDASTTTTPAAEITSNNTSTQPYVLRLNRVNTGTPFNPNNSDHTLLRLDSGDLNYGYGQELITGYKQGTKKFAVNADGDLTFNNALQNGTLRVRDQFADDGNSGGDHLLWVSSTNERKIGLRNQTWWSSLGAQGIELGTANAPGYGSYSIKFKAGTGADSTFSLVPNNIGNVAIGQSTASARLHVANHNSSQPALILEGSGGQGAPLIRLTQKSNTATSRQAAYIDAQLIDGSDANFGADLHLATSYAGTVAPRAMVASDGVLPPSDFGANLGRSNLRWGQGHFVTAHADNFKMSDGAALTTQNPPDVGVTEALHLNNTGLRLFFSTNRWTCQLSDLFDFVPGADNQYNLGSTSKRVKEIFLAEGIAGNAIFRPLATDSGNNLIVKPSGSGNGTTLTLFAASDTDNSAYAQYSISSNQIRFTSGANGSGAKRDFALSGGLFRIGDFNQAEGQLHVVPPSATTVPLVVEGVASQSVPLIRLKQKSNSGTSKDAGGIDAQVVDGSDSNFSGYTVLSTVHQNQVRPAFYVRSDGWPRCIATGVTIVMLTPT